MNATLKITTHGTLQFNSFFIITTGVGFMFRVYIRNKCFGTKKKKKHFLMIVNKQIISQIIVSIRKYLFEKKYVST